MEVLRRRIAPYVSHQRWMSSSFMMVTDEVGLRRRFSCPVLVTFTCNSGYLHLSTNVCVLHPKISLLLRETPLSWLMTRSQQQHIMSTFRPFKWRWNHQTISNTEVRRCSGHAVHHLLWTRKHHCSNPILWLATNFFLLLGWRLPDRREAWQFVPTKSRKTAVAFQSHNTKKLPRPALIYTTVTSYSLHSVFKMPIKEDDT